MDSAPQSVEDTHNECDTTCWCGPALICAECGEVGHCLHGPAGGQDKTEVVVHQAAS